MPKPEYKLLREYRKLSPQGKREVFQFCPLAPRSGSTGEVGEKIEGERKELARSWICLNLFNLTRRNMSLS